MVARGDTIAAIATPPGYGGVGIVRVSGPNVASIARALLGELPAPRYAKHCQFLGPTKQVLDEGLALYFPSPNSYTGEDVLELQGHGGPVVLDQVLQSTLSYGARVALPGEFTERAFLNQKMDLAQAEAVSDLIHASSKHAATLALQSLQGRFSAEVERFLSQLVYLRTWIEAAIDFPDDEVDLFSEGDIENKLNDLLEQLKTTRRSAQHGVVIQEGVSIAIIGAPNAGKSTLLNRFAGAERAIVSSQPGTTRDVIREYIDLDGLPVHVMDTAGLRESADDIEKEGMRRAKQSMQEANIILFVVDASQDIQAQLLMLSEQARDKTLVVFNKADCVDQAITARIDVGDLNAVLVSAKTGEGMVNLYQQIHACAGLTHTEGKFIARRRHLDALEQCCQHVSTAYCVTIAQRQLEVVAEELLLAQQALSTITGQFTSDDLLGSIFSTFCLGK